MTFGPRLERNGPKDWAGQQAIKMMEIDIFHKRDPCPNWLWVLCYFMLFDAILSRDAPSGLQGIDQWAEGQKLKVGIRTFCIKTKL